MTFNPAALMLHGAAVSIMYWGYFALGGTEFDGWIKDQKGGHFQFLTIQGLAVAWITMVMSLAADLFPGASVFKNIKRILFMIAMPLAVVISTIYWSLVLFAPSLILMPDPTAEPTSAGPAVFKIPLQVDLALHAAPGITLFLDFFLFENRYLKKQALFGAPAVAISAGVWYVGWVEYFAKHNGTFPYPFLNDTVEVRGTIYGGAVVLALVSFWILNAVHR